MVESFGSPTSLLRGRSDRPYRVLIADREPGHVDRLVEALRAARVAPVVCDDPARASSLISSGTFDVIVVDLYAPGYAGHDLLTRVRDRHAGPRVIVCTAMDDLDTAVACMRQGAVDYIRKPCDPGAVVASALQAAERRLLELERSDLRELMRRSKHALMIALEARDGYTIRHCVNVAFLARRFAEYIHAPEETIEAIDSVGELHDVGKIGIEDAILNKSGPYTESEYEAMRFHPQIGLEIIDPLGAFPEEGALVIAHHERWDGRGYPAGLRGNAIPLVARITAVADVFDACTTVRPYRTAMPVTRALQIIEGGAGGSFDPELARAFGPFFVSQFGENGARYDGALARHRYRRHSAP